MNDLSDAEYRAVVFAAKCAGQYLDSIRVTDLALLTHTQWMELIKLICLNFATQKIS